MDAPTVHTNTHAGTAAPDALIRASQLTKTYWMGTPAQHKAGGGH